MKNKKVDNADYSPIKFLKDFVVIEVVIMYLTLLIGDIVQLGIDDDSRILSRVVPTFLVAIISVFLIIKTKAKKCKKSEEQELRRFSFISPIIVAIIVLVYGLYSVNTNIKEIREEIDNQTNIYSMFLGEEETDQYVDEMIKNAEAEAIRTWIITSVVYLVGAEASVLISNRKLKLYLKDDIVMENSYNPMMQNNYGDTFNNPNSQNDAQSVNNINWNL